MSVRGELHLQNSLTACAGVLSSGACTGVGSMSVRHKASCREGTGANQGRLSCGRDNSSYSHAQLACCAQAVNEAENQQQAPPRHVCLRAQKLVRGWALNVETANADRLLRGKLSSKHRLYELNRGVLRVDEVAWQYLNEVVPNVERQPAPRYVRATSRLCLQAVSCEDSSVLLSHSGERHSRFDLQAFQFDLH